MDRKLTLAAEGFQEVDRAAQPVGVYCLLLRGEVVYVGQSVSVYRRLAQHHGSAKQKKNYLNTPLGGSHTMHIEFDAVMVKWCSKDRLDLLEEELIRRYRPKHNIIIRDELPDLPVDLSALGLNAVDTSFKRRHL